MSVPEDFAPHTRRSPFTDPPLLEVTPLEASLGRITWPLSGDTDMNLDLGISGEVEAGIDGSLAFASGNGTIAYQLLTSPQVITITKATMKINRNDIAIVNPALEGLRDCLFLGGGAALMVRRPCLLFC